MSGHISLPEQAAETRRLIAEMTDVAAWLERARPEGLLYDSVLPCLRAAAKALTTAPAGWLEIGSAPTDGSLIDVWCVTPPESDFVPEAGGIRLTDVSWREPDEVSPQRGWCRVTDDGDMDMLEDEAAGLCGLPPWIPVFWMRPPHPPTVRQALSGGQPTIWSGLNPSQDTEAMIG